MDGGGLTDFFLLFVSFPPHRPCFLSRHVHNGQQRLLIPVTRGQHDRFIQELVDSVKKLVSTDGLVSNVMEMLQNRISANMILKIWYCSIVRRSTSSDHCNFLMLWLSINYRNQIPLRIILYISQFYHLKCRSIYNLKFKAKKHSYIKLLTKWHKSNDCVYVRNDIIRLLTWHNFIIHLNIMPKYMKEQCHNWAIDGCRPTWLAISVEMDRPTSW